MAKASASAPSRWISSLVILAALLMPSCGGSGNSGGGGGGGNNPPPTPTGLTATAGNGIVNLSWSASATATSYTVSRGTTSGGPYSSIATPSATSYADNAVTNGSTYYYVVSATNANGTSANSAQAFATPVGPPATPTGLTAAAGNGLVNLSWTASTGAASYIVSRGTVSGGPYTQIATPTQTNYTDSGLTNGKTYYYVVSAVNATGTSANSAQASATPTGSSTSVSVTIDSTASRHPISPYVYGGAFPKDASTITDSGLPVVRWGGNGASTYNWKLGTTNADNDYYFEDFAFGALNNSADSNSTQFITDVKAAGSIPLMTMVMLPWVAQSAETSIQQGDGANNYHWSFSASQDGESYCSVDQYNNDAGNGIESGSSCSSSPVYYTATTAAINRTYFPLLDDTTQACPSGNCVYRKDWATAMATAFGNSVPHFYDMDNEIDIWGGTHRDIHPSPTTYDELSNVFLTEASNLKAWDPAAVRLGPVSCCWYFYWRSATGNGDTSSHGGVDFLPWWLNQIAWSDAVAGARSLDVFDIHAYPDADTGSLSQSQLQALALSIYRDWWDPTFPSAASYIRNGGFSIEPADSKPFRIPRMRALVNQAYPGTQFSITEWSAAFAGESDFSTALGDADAYGILGQQRVYLSTRWTAPSPTNPNYLALKLYTNYDGSHHGFQPISISATNTGNPSLFSSYAAVSADGKTMSVMVLNKDPVNTAAVTFSLPNNQVNSATTYTLVSSNPTAITKATPAWSSTMNFAPYSATLLVLSVSPTVPAAEWDLNPDTIMVPASGTVKLSPKITSGSANVTLTAAVFDAFEGAAACSGTITLTASTITPTTPGTINVNAATTPGFCHFTVTGTDGTVSQTQGGWIVVGNPAATFTQTGNNQTGGSLTLTATLVPGSSRGTKTGASILFTTDKGTLSQRLVTTDSSGNATVTLTLPSGSGTATVTAEGPYGLGHPIATFTESN